jgi:glycosyltransferase involved in cell wall biosynthesis
VPHADLVGVYNLALALLYPSLYEGFGLPILEGMACGTPVITSDVSAMPEVAGGAALLVEPSKADSIGAAIEKVAGDAALRQSLREKGLARAAAMPWSSTARETLAIYRSVL